MPRFVFSLCAIKDAKDIGNGSIHFKVRFGVASLRSKNVEVASGKGSIDESFCFGVPDRPKKTDCIAHVELRVNKLMTQFSATGGKADIPLLPVFQGSPLNKWFPLDKNGSILVQCHLDTPDDAPPQYALQEPSSPAGGVSPPPFSFEKYQQRVASASTIQTRPPPPPPPPSLFLPKDVVAGAEKLPRKPAYYEQPQRQSSPPAAVPAPSSSSGRASPHPVSTTGCQTDRLSLSQQEFDALFSRLPDPSVAPAKKPDPMDILSPSARDEKGKSSEPGAIPKGVRFAGVLQDKPPALTPASVAAMRAASVAWPEDEVEGILLYCHQLQKENDRQSVRAARAAVQVAKGAASGLQSLNEIVGPTTAGSPSRAPAAVAGASRSHSSLSTDLAAPGLYGYHSPQGLERSRSPLPSRHHSVGIRQPNAQLWLENAPSALGMHEPSAEEAAELAFLYDTL